MYLTKLTLNRGLPDNIWQIHRLVMKGFGQLDQSTGAGRVLFRICRRATNRPEILIQSPDRPRWDNIEYETKVFGLTVEQGTILRFDLRANPTRRKIRRVGIRDEEELLAWLRSKGEEGGFTPMNVEINQENAVLGGKREGDVWRRLIFNSVCFTGLLQVDDPHKFKAMFMEGIGPAKGFGFGMLLVGR